EARTGMTASDARKKWGDINTLRTAGRYPRAKRKTASVTPNTEPRPRPTMANFASIDTGRYCTTKSNQRQPNPTTAVSAAATVSRRGDRTGNGPLFTGQRARAASIANTLTPIAAP